MLKQCTKLEEKNPNKNQQTQTNKTLIKVESINRQKKNDNILDICRFDRKKKWSGYNSRLRYCDF